MARRMIPWFWLRLVIVIGFAGFFLYKGLPWLAVIAVFLMAVTIAQLVIAYRQPSMQKEPVAAKTTKPANPKNKKSKKK